MLLLPSDAVTGRTLIICLGWCCNRDASILPIDLSISAGNRCFQSRAAGSQQIKLGLHALLLDLQLSAARFSQLFRARATYTNQTTLNVFRLEIFFDLLHLCLQFGLLCLRLD